MQKTGAPAGSARINFEENSHQFFLELLGVVVAGGFSFVGAYLLLKLTNLITPLRVSPQEEERSLDLSQHGEKSHEEPKPKGNIS